MKSRTRRRSLPNALLEKARALSRRGWIVLVLCLGTAITLVDAVLLPSATEYQHHRPESSALIEQRIAEARTVGRSIQVRRTWIPLQRVDQDLVRAVLVAEDAAFFEHAGFDLSELWSAISTSIRDWKSPRGASTISQQLAKNLYLSSERSLLRKWREAIITMKMERSLTKTRILELYLNLIEWGDGVFGAEAAARHYFGKSASALTVDEASFLAAIIPNPKAHYNPAIHPRRVSARQRVIRRAMERYSLPRPISNPKEPKAIEISGEVRK